MIHEEVLLMGEVKVFNQPVVMKCLGLGSCVGLFVKDRNTGISGGAHIFLPENILPENVNLIATVELLLAKMKTLGSDLSFLRAKLTGGSNVLGKSFDIGSLNITSVIDQLTRNRIYIAAQDVGGRVSRSARFDASTESLIIQVMETKQTLTI